MRPPRAATQSAARCSAKVPTPVSRRHILGGAAAVSAAVLGPRDAYANSKPGVVRSDPRVGSKAFGHTLPDTRGKTQTFRPRGHVSFVAFWASWCSPCRKELPLLDKVFRSLECSTPARLILVSLDEERALTTNALTEFGVHRTSAFDGGTVYARYLAPALPWAFLSNASGSIDAVYRGFDPACASELEARVRRLVAS